MKSQLLIALLLTLGFIPLSLAKECGTAKIVGGKTCEDLKLTFDYTGCSEKSTRSPKMICQGTEGTATISTSHYTYSTKVISAWGSWNADSTLTETAAAAVPAPPKTPKAKSEAKALPVPKPVVAAPAPSAPATPAPAIVRPTPAPVATTAAAPASNLTVKGQIRVRAEKDDHNDMLTKKDYTFLRGRLDVSYVVNPEIKVFAQPQFSKTFGQRSLNTSTTTANANVETSGNTVDTGIDMHQMYLDYHPLENLSLIIGRQTLAYGDQIVIGGSDWGNVGRSFDAIKGRWTHKIGWVDVFNAKLFDNNTNTTAAPVGDKDLNGLYSNLNFSWLDNLDLYVLQKNDRTAATTTSLDVYGARVQSQISFVDYRAEYTNENSDAAHGYQYDVELGFQVIDKKLRVAVETLRVSKDYDSLYPSGHTWLGYADVLGRRNLDSNVVHVMYQPNAIWKFNADYHMFTRLDDSDAVYKINGTTKIGTAGGSDSNDVGQEFDLTVKYKINANASFTAGWSEFFAKEYLTDQFEPGDIRVVYGSLQTEF